MRYNADHVLIDGYSVVHAWPGLRAAMARSLESARDRLVAELTRLQDAVGIPVAVVFDSRVRGRPSHGETPAGIEVVFTRKGMTADTFIERLLAKSRSPERFLVVTDDGAESFMVRTLGGQVITAEQLSEWLSSEGHSLSDEVAQLGRSEGRKFHRHNG